MADSILKGITGLDIGNGDGGHVALALQDAVLDILSSQNLVAHLTARAQTSTTAGTVAYYKAFTAQTSSYSVGQKITQKPQIGLVSIDLDTFRSAVLEIEDFDESRLGASGNTALNIVAGSLARAASADMEAAFLCRMFVLGTDEAGTAWDTNKTVELPELATDDVSVTGQQIKDAFTKLSYIEKGFRKTFNKEAVGMNTKSVIAVLDSFAETNAARAVTTGSNGDRAIATIIKGDTELNTYDRTVREFMGVKYITSDMIGTSILKGTSFNADKDIDLTNFVGAIYSADIVAFPNRVVKITTTINPENGNRRYIIKYMYGFGVTRDFGYKIILKDKDTPPPAGTDILKKKQQVGKVKEY